MGAVNVHAAATKDHNRDPPEQAEIWYGRQSHRFQKTAGQGTTDLDHQEHVQGDEAQQMCPRGVFLGLGMAQTQKSPTKPVAQSRTRIARRREGYTQPLFLRKAKYVGERAKFGLLRRSERKHFKARISSEIWPCPEVRIKLQFPCTLCSVHTLGIHLLWRTISCFKPDFSCFGWGLHGPCAIHSGWVGQAGCNLDTDYTLRVYRSFWTRLEATIGWARPGTVQIAINGQS